VFLFFPCLLFLFIVYLVYDFIINIVNKLIKFAVDTKLVGTVSGECEINQLSLDLKQL